LRYSSTATTGAPAGARLALPEEAYHRRYSVGVAKTCPGLAGWTQPVAGVSTMGAGSAMAATGGSGEESETEAKASPRRSLAANADSASSGLEGEAELESAVPPALSPPPPPSASAATSSTSSARYSSIDVTFCLPPEFQYEYVVSQRRTSAAARPGRNFSKAGPTFRRDR